MAPEGVGRAQQLADGLSSDIASGCPYPLPGPVQVTAIQGDVTQAHEVLGEGFDIYTNDSL